MSMSLSMKLMIKKWSKKKRRNSSLQKGGDAINSFDKKEKMLAIKF